MSTITLPNRRVGSDLTVRLKLKDGGLAIDWSTLSRIKAFLYSDAQRAMAGRCDVSVDGDDPTILVCRYASTKMQYLGVNRIIVQCSYLGETKTYDKPALNFVRWTSDQEGEELTIDDPDIDVEIDVEDVTSAILQNILDACIQATEEAREVVDTSRGPRGYSAYEIAVQDGFEGTEEEWLESLQGETGPQGPEGPQGETGPAGVTDVEVDVSPSSGTPAGTGSVYDGTLSLHFTGLKGQSAYEVAVENGFEGTEEEWLASLVGPQGAQGIQGETGEAAGFGTVSVSLQEDGGQPSATVAASGTDTAKNFAFTFNNLKGDKGDKGDQGNTGSSVDYPYELVNNCTTNDATKGLAASQGVALASEVSQLEAKVGNLTEMASSAEVPGNDNTMVRSDYLKVIPGHIYRVYLSNPTIARNNITYTSASYDILSMSLYDSSKTAIVSPVKIGANKKSEAFAQYYDIICPANAAYIGIGMRANAGAVQEFRLFDITEEYEIPINTKVGYITNAGAVSYVGTHNRVSWYRVRKRTKVSITSSCSDVILGTCASIGADSSITPVINGLSSNEITASVFFEEETIIVITWLDNDADFAISFECGGDAFEPAYGDKGLIDIFEGGDISGIGTFRKTPVFDTAMAANYFEMYAGNGLTGTKSIKITGRSNRVKTISFVSGRAYAIIMTLRCDAFTPVASGTATGYNERGGAFVGFGADADKFSNLHSWNFMPTTADKKYHTIIVMATCVTSGNYAVYFGTKNPDDGTIAGTFYMDNAFVIDLTALFGSSLPSFGDVVGLFGKYLRLYTKQNFINDGYSDRDMKDSFVDAMNRRAAYLGMDNSAFSNPGGSSEVGNYFTANDGLKMLCAFGQSRLGMLLGSIPEYDIPIRGENARTVTVTSIYKGAEQVTRLYPYTIVAGKTGTLNADAHADVGGDNMNTANVGLIVKSPVDGALLAGVVILPLVKVGTSWKTQDGDSSPYNSRFTVLKQLFDLLERAREGEDVSTEVNALGCGYAAACVLPSYIDNVGSVAKIQKAGDTKCFPASMTKLMTAIVLTDAIDTNRDIALYGSDVMGGSGADFRGGDIIKAGDAVVGMMLSSANTLASTFSRVFGLRYLD